MASWRNPGSYIDSPYRNEISPPLAGVVTERHHQCVRDELGAHVVGERPAHYPTTGRSITVDR